MIKNMKNFNPNKIWFKKTAVNDSNTGEPLIMIELFYGKKVYHMTCVENKVLEMEKVEAQFRARFIERVRQGDV